MAAPADRAMPEQHQPALGAGRVIAGALAGLSALGAGLWTYATRVEPNWIEVRWTSGLV